MPVRLNLLRDSPHRRVSKLATYFKIRSLSSIVRIRCDYPDVSNAGFEDPPTDGSDKPPRGCLRTFISFNRDYLFRSDWKLSGSSISSAPRGYSKRSNQWFQNLASVKKIPMCNLRFSLQVGLRRVAYRTREDLER